MANKKKNGKKKCTPFGKMLFTFKKSSINPRTHKLFTNEGFAEAANVSERMIYEYKYVIPSYYTVCDLITALRLHPIDAIRLAKAAGYDITVDTEDNRYLWDKITVNWACRLKEKVGKKATK